MARCLFGGRVTSSRDGSTLAVAATLEDRDALAIGGDQDDSTLDAGAVYLH